MEEIALCVEALEISDFNALEVDTKASFSAFPVLVSKLDSTLLMTSSNISGKILLIALTSSASLSAAVPAASEMVSTKSSRSLRPFDASSPKLSLIDVFDSGGVEDVGIGLLTVDFGVANPNLKVEILFPIVDTEPNF